MIQMLKRFEQIKEMNSGLSTLMILCLTVYGANYSKVDIEEAMDLVDGADYRKADREAIVTSLVNLTKKQVKKSGKRAI